VGHTFDAYTVETEKINNPEINPRFRGSPAEIERGCIPLAVIKGELNRAYTYKVLQGGVM
jgi:hypothetical protein